MFVVMLKAGIVSAIIGQVASGTDVPITEIECIYWVHSQLLHRTGKIPIPGPYEEVVCVKAKTAPGVGLPPP
jgi:hypothetical protein|tara:strand:- start:2840 stop:3055 length:216 start_codon:yes stop_codon:yes gene_type:complete